MKKEKIILIILTSILAVITIVLSVKLFILRKPYRDSLKLIKAIKNEDIAEIEQMLESGVDPNVITASEYDMRFLNALETGPQRPLSVACDVANLEIVEMLIEHGATAEPDDKSGWSPLNQTLFHYQPDDKAIVELLLKYGADINEDNPYGQPIFNAVAMTPEKYDKKENNRVYYVDGYDVEVAQGITNIVKMLLEYGEFDVNLKSSYNDATLLITATKSENICLVEYLLSIGCDVTLEDNANKTALDYAQEYKNEEIIKLLKHTGTPHD